MPEHPRSLPPGSWCTRCGARPGIAGPEWICRICIARADRLPDAAIRNAARRPLPAGTPRARDRYRLAGLCVQCGRRRDRADRLTCRRCRRRLADATLRYRKRHGERTAAERRAHRRYLAERRARWTAAGLCPECGADRDRDDRKLCARCGRRAAERRSNQPLSPRVMRRSL